MTQATWSILNVVILEFAGIDLKVTPDNEVYCFEVNPCPAFSYYENNTNPFRKVSHAI